MARVREFDPEDAILGAMNVFWRSGYGDTTMEDIVSETGVSRYGLYGTFGNKKEILLAAMRHYEQRMSDLVLSDLRKPGAGRAEIIGHWAAMRQHAEEEDFCNGCLIVNMLVALSHGGALMIRAGTKPSELEGAIEAALFFLRRPNNSG
jgi:TetR/AcrR family transcriptional repressor of nem operon